MKLRFFAFIAFVACLSACTFGDGGENYYGKGLLEKGTMAPDFVIYTDDKPDGFTLSSLRGGYVLLEFWASWCSDCQAATPELVSLYNEYAPKGLTVVGVSFDEDADDWRAYISEHGMYWIHYCELKPWSESTISAAYNVKWIPTLYLIDPDGKVDFATVTVSEMDKVLSERFNHK